MLLEERKRVRSIAHTMGHRAQPGPQGREGGERGERSGEGLKKKLPAPRPAEKPIRLIHKPSIPSILTIN